jgi:uncharacterized protein YjdB
MRCNADETRPTAALGHNWSAWTVTTAATCETAGVETRTCNRNAAHTETRAINALGHTWSGWTVTLPPTITTEGEERRTCSVCGATETRSIDKLPIISVTGITLNRNTLTLEVGKTEQLTATINPANATDKTVTWSSNNTAVAMVSNSGSVTVISEGTAAITVTTLDGNYTAVCMVTVTAPKVTGAETVFAPDLNIYPNPFTDEIRIVGAEGCTLHVMNAAGAVVHTQIIATPDESISLGHLSAGVYLLIIEKDGNVKTERVVKN